MRANDPVIGTIVLLCSGWGPYYKLSGLRFAIREDAMKHGQSYFHVALAAVLAGFSLTANAIILIPQLHSNATVEFDFPSLSVPISTPCDHSSTVGATVGCSGSTAVPGTSATLNYPSVPIMSETRVF